MTTSTEPSEGPVPLIVDTDLAADDVVALAYLTASPRVDLLAVIVSGTGEVTCPRGAELAAALLAELGHPDVPVACGVSEPLSGDRRFPRPTIQFHVAAPDGTPRRDGRRHTSRYGIVNTVGTLVAADDQPDVGWPYVQGLLFDGDLTVSISYRLTVLSGVGAAR